VSGQSLRISIAVAYNAGVPVLCVGNGTLDESVLYSPTTISSGATAVNTAYSAATVSANSPMRLIGYVDVPNVTAGTYATITQVQSYGGAVTPASIGIGQTWQNMIGSRANATTYTNTAGKPIEVKAISNFNSLAIGNYYFYVNGNLVDNNQVGQSANGVGSQMTVGAIVPPGATYQANVTGGLSAFWELR
jgi:hypothetical protein